VRAESTSLLSYMRLNNANTTFKLVMHVRLHQHQIVGIHGNRRKHPALIPPRRQQPRYPTYTYEIVNKIGSDPCNRLVSVRCTHRQRAVAFSYEQTARRTTQLSRQQQISCTNVLAALLVRFKVLATLVTTYGYRDGHSKILWCGFRNQICGTCRMRSPLRVCCCLGRTKKMFFDHFCSEQPWRCTYLQMEKTFPTIVQP